MQAASPRPKRFRRRSENTSRTDDVAWLEDALRDLDDIAATIAADRPRAAEIVVRRIVETAGVLAYHPRIGRENPDKRTRRLVVTGTPYIVVYRLRERIGIIAISHGSRKWPDSFSTA